MITEIEKEYGDYFSMLKKLQSLQLNFGLQKFWHFDIESSYIGENYHYTDGWMIIAKIYKYDLSKRPNDRMTNHQSFVFEISYGNSAEKNEKKYLDLIDHMKLAK